MYSFSQFLGESNKTDFSWYHHPELGVVSKPGFHQHFNLGQEHPSFREQPRKISKGYGTINHATKEYEIHAYPEIGQSSLTPSRKKKVETAVAKHLKASYGLQGYKQTTPKEETTDRRSSARWWEK